MQVYDDEKGNREAFLGIVLEVETLATTYKLSERIVSIALRNGTIESLKANTEARMISELITKLQSDVYKRGKEIFELEWSRLMEAFPNPLPMEEIEKKKPKATRKRCSRQLTKAELNEEVQRLLKELGDLQNE